jgi:transaldolase
MLKLIPDRPVSFEVFADDFATMEARKGAKSRRGEANVYVKIPITNTRGEFAGALMTRLSGAGTKLNVTAIMTKGRELAEAGFRPVAGSQVPRFGSISRVRRCHGSQS